MSIFSACFNLLGRRPLAQVPAIVANRAAVPPAIRPIPSALGHFTRLKEEYLRQKTETQAQMRSYQQTIQEQQRTLQIVQNQLLQGQAREKNLADELRKALISQNQFHFDLEAVRSDSQTNLTKLNQLKQEIRTKKNLLAEQERMLNAQPEKRALRERLGRLMREEIGLLEMALQRFQLRTDPNLINARLLGKWKEVTARANLLYRNLQQAHNEKQQLAVQKAETETALQKTTTELEAARRKEYVLIQQLSARDAEITQLQQRSLRQEEASRSQLLEANRMIEHYRNENTRLNADLQITRNALHLNINALEQISTAGVPGGPVLLQPVRDIAIQLRNIASANWDRPAPPPYVERNVEAERLVEASRSAHQALQREGLAPRRPERADDLLRAAHEHVQMRRWRVGPQSAPAAAAAPREVARPVIRPAEPEGNEERMIREALDYFRARNRAIAPVLAPGEIDLDADNDPISL